MLTALSTPRSTGRSSASASKPSGRKSKVERSGSVVHDAEVGLYASVTTGLRARSSVCGALGKHGGPNSTSWVAGARRRLILSPQRSAGRSQQIEFEKRASAGRPRHRAAGSQRSPQRKNRKQYRIGVPRDRSQARGVVGELSLGHSSWAEQCRDINPGARLPVPSRPKRGFAARRKGRGRHQPTISEPSRLARLGRIVSHPASSDPKISPLHETGASPDLLLGVGTRQRPAGPRNRSINRKVSCHGFPYRGLGTQNR
jgi:hypothetical protein